MVHIQNSNERSVIQDVLCLVVSSPQNAVFLQYYPTKTSLKTASSEIT